jgi:hypothetical protein
VELIIYNIKTGKNTVLRGLIAEEFARYTLTQRYPVIVIRPEKVLEFLTEQSIEGPHVQFLRQYSHTMDFFGLGPILVADDSPSISISKMVQDFFYKQNGLTKFLIQPFQEVPTRGYIIEVKSRSTKNYWKPFQYSFSENQEKMFSNSKLFNFEIVLCGVTFAQEWEIAVVFTNLEGKILPQGYFMEDRYKQVQNSLEL